MKQAPLLGCGCLGAAAALVLCVPLLLFGGGDSAGASTTGAVIAAGGGSCTKPVGCQAIPAELIGVPNGFFPDSFTDPAGECTSWAAALWPGHHAHGVTWSGDAWSWYGNAAAAGYAVAVTPSVGAIAVFARTGTAAGRWGHVAVVLALTATGFVVTEMNWAGRFVVDRRQVALDDLGLVGFIPVPADAWS